MDFLWPNFLYLAGIIPLAVVLYVWMQRRRHRFAVRYSSLELVRTALKGQNRIKRHIPFILFLTGMCALVLALGRPAAIVSVPTDQTTIILTLDVSGSMMSRDISPSRLEAAEQAMMNFIQNQKSSTQIGVVAFSGFAELVQPPTTDQEALQNVIESLIVGRRTAIGSGILKAIDAISEVDKNVAPSVYDTSSGVEPTPVPPGAYAPDIIVLLTDGVSNAGPLPLDAAQQAVDRGIRIYTIGYGTPNGSVPFGGQGGFGGGPYTRGGGFYGGWGGGFYGGGGFGGGFRAGIDDVDLKKIAAMTGGAYYTAGSADELQNVFQNLPTYLISKHEIMEVSVFFAAGGAVLALLAIILSFLWNPLN